jgi:hypothetical protein
MLLQHSAWKRFNLAKGNRLKTARALKTKAKAANAAEQV